MDERMKKKLPLLVIPLAGLLVIAVMYNRFSSVEENKKEDLGIGVGVIVPNDTISKAQTKVIAYEQNSIDRDMKKRLDNQSFMFNEEETNKEDSIRPSDKFLFEEQEAPVPEPVETIEPVQTAYKSSGRQKELEQFHRPEANKKEAPKRRRREGESFYDNSPSKTGTPSSRNRSFDFGDNSHPSGGKLYSASFFNDQEITPNGSQVAIKVNENIKLKDGNVIDKNTIVYGTTSLSNNRITITVRGININEVLIPVTLSVVTDEGIKGFPVEQGEGMGRDGAMRTGRTIANIGRSLGVLGGVSIPSVSSGRRKEAKLMIQDNYSFYLLEE